MPEKHPNTERIGGPGASHENRAHPERTQQHLEHPTERKSPARSKVSGGGGEQDSHHSHDPGLKSGKKE
jgi:hypothetical protein